MTSLLGQFREEDAEAAGLVKGVAVGLVVENEDPEGMARVKVSYPWREDSEQSFWARITVPMAGADYGTYFLPEKGDEVLLCFDRGDVRFPYVIGGLWNGQDKPPEKNDGKNDVRKIKSRSGHEITLNDNDSKGHIEIKTEDGKKLYLDKEKAELSDGGGNVIEIDFTKGGIKLKSATSIDIESAQINVKASGALKLEAGGTCTIKGTMVMIN